MKKIITICDYRNYDERNCNNGGNYAFFRDYRRMPDGRYRVEFSTSADFEYCPHCGWFVNGNHPCYDKEDPWQYVTEKEAMDDYNYVQSLNDENYYGEIEEE